MTRYGKIDFIKMRRSIGKKKLGQRMEIVEPKYEMAFHKEVLEFVRLVKQVDTMNAEDLLNIHSMSNYINWVKSLTPENQQRLFIDAVNNGVLLLADLVFIFLYPSF